MHATSGVRALLLAALGTWACQHGSPGTAEGRAGAPGAGVTPSSSAVARGGATRPEPARQAAAAPRAGAACRVMRVTGDVRRAGTELVVGTRVDGAPLIELATSSTLHLVHTTSTRQWVVSGPARLLA